MAQDEPEVAQANAKTKRRALTYLVALAVFVAIVYAALQLGWMVRVFL
jgi:hypothetical protein